MKSSSFKTAYANSLLLGSASLINVAMGLIRNKAVAMLLGPSGVGLVGLLQTLVSTVSTAFTLGLNQSGTRQVSVSYSSADAHSLEASVWALKAAVILLGALGGFVVFGLSEHVSILLFSTNKFRTEISVVSIAIFLSVAMVASKAIVNGTRRVTDHARITVLSGIVSTVMSIFLITVLGEKAVPLVVISTPLCMYLIAEVYVGRAEFRGVRPHSKELITIWVKLARLGAAVMLSGLVVSGAQLVIRAEIQSKLGAVALGMFTAGWVISQNYIGFLYSAITTDYYPRLSQAIAKSDPISELINDQTRIGLMISGPLFVLLAGFAPFLLALLFTAEFEAGSRLLRVLVIGDILKVVEYPLSFALLAHGSGRAYLISRIFGSIVFVCVALVLIPIIGAIGAAWGYLGMHLAYFPVLAFLVHRRIAFRLDKGLVASVLLTFAAVVLILVCAKYSERLAMVVAGVVATFMLSLVAKRAGEIPQLARLLNKVREIMRP